MITKDELALLERRPAQNNELHYTIGGAVETAVHSNLDAERTSKLITGHRAMNSAVETFRDNMAFKSREGLAQSHFQQSAPDTHKDIPPHDLPLAENTWRENHIEAHKKTFDAASHQLRASMSAATQGDLPHVDMDSGYGASPNQDITNPSVNHGLKQQQAINDDRVKAFAQDMRQGRTQTQDVER